MYTYITAEDRDALDEPPHPPRRRDADRVREHELVRAGETLAEVGDGGGIDLALERAAERARDRHRRGPLSARQDRPYARDRLLERRIGVAAVEALRRRERQVDAVEAGRRETIVAALVEHEARQLRAAPLRK